MSGFTEKELTIPTVKGGTLSAKLCIPEGFVDPTAVKDSSASDVYPPLGSGHRRIIIQVHGLQGHMDYCYMEKFSRQCCEINKTYTLRFDFRGNGGSSDIESPLGRTIEEDFADLDAVIREFAVKKYGFYVTGLAGHSRGATAVMLWALREQQRPDHENPIYIPSIANCASRYHYDVLAETIAIKSPGLFKDKGMWGKAKRFGKFVDVWYPLAEIENLNKLDTAQLKNLRPETDILSVYGQQDHIVPITDAPYYANMFAGRHTLKFIPDADHNYYQTTIDPNTNKPIRINHNPKVVDTLCEFFSLAAERDRFVHRQGTYLAIPTQGQALGSKLRIHPKNYPQL